MTENPWTESGLQELFDFIRGAGRFVFLKESKWIHTHPTGDANQQAIYAGCCELERRGCVLRVTEEPDHVVFEVIEEKR